MYSFLHELLADKKGGAVFSCFGGWHFFYILLAAAAAAAVLYGLRNKSADAKKNAAKTFLSIAFGLYMADFFLMPLAYGEIDIEKLPFHACTAMCAMCFLSYHSRRIGKYRSSFVMLGFISNLVYLIYPAGVMWHQVSPLSYRVVQTLLFHAAMSVYGFLFLVYERRELCLKHCRSDLAVLVGMTLWAMLGNSVYNGTSGSYSHFFNWFFVVRDPFYMLPAHIAPYVMPLLNIAAFFAAELLVSLILHFAGRKSRSA
ncbi:MAG: hypothetical protein E7330_08195 [Clostridiales bacterium]|nr:hypothetical protein [Clostridiales bacterium]